MTRSCHYKQLIKSAVILVLFVVACIFVDFILSLRNQPVYTVSENVVNEVLVHDKTAGSALEEYPEYLLSSFSAEVPQDFKEECFDPSGFENLYASNDGSVVSFFLNAERNEAYDFIKHSLEEKEWAYVESEIDNKTTFIKSSGSIRWLFVEVYASGLGSVVLITTEGGFDE